MVMSALPPKADIRQQIFDVRFVPIAVKPLTGGISTSMVLIGNHSHTSASQREDHHQKAAPRDCSKLGRTKTGMAIMMPVMIRNHPIRYVQGRSRFVMYASRVTFAFDPQRISALAQTFA